MRPGRRVGLALGVFVVALAAVLALTMLQVPRLLLSPGGALDVAPRVEFVAHQEDPVNGRLLLTTVSISQPSVGGLLKGILDDDVDVIRREAVIPEGVEAGEYFAAQREVFVEAGQVAAAVGLRAAGLEAAVTGDGARVLAVGADAPAAQALRIDDVIVAVDGREIALASDLVTNLTMRQSEEEVELTVRRGTDTLRPRVRLGRLAQGRAGLGVAVATQNQSVDLPFEVRIEDEQIGGPSAGLMIALSVYDLATDADLAAGRTVAGTGTMGPTGEVGPVGGVTQKVAAAVAAGATLFLVPPAEAASARSAAGKGLQVVEVETFDDAVRALDGDDGR